MDLLSSGFFNLAFLGLDPRISLPSSAFLTLSSSGSTRGSHQDSRDPRIKSEGNKDSRGPRVKREGSKGDPRIKSEGNKGDPRIKSEGNKDSRGLSDQVRGKQGLTGALGSSPRETISQVRGKS